MLKLINGSLTGGVNYEEVYMVTEDNQKKNYRLQSNYKYEQNTNFGRNSKKGCQIRESETR
jgi:hypothetical protein